MSCINLKIKTKKGRRFLYCNLLKQEITFDNCKDCATKEYKKIKCIIKPKKYAKIKGHKHKLTKATSIPISVKKEVWERDNHKCIFCGKEVPLFCANSHVIKRSQLGLGIPQNIVCACTICHDKYDFDTNSQKMYKIAEKHLKTIYIEWNKNDMVYKKFND